jgi:hypothetical protein
MKYGDCAASLSLRCPRLVAAESRPPAAGSWPAFMGCRRETGDSRLPHSNGGSSTRQHNAWSRAGRTATGEPGIHSAPAPAGVRLLSGSVPSARVRPTPEARHVELFPGSAPRHHCCPDVVPLWRSVVAGFAADGPATLHRIDRAESFSRTQRRPH